MKKEKDVTIRNKTKGRVIISAAGGEAFSLWGEREGVVNHALLSDEVFKRNFDRLVANGTLEKI